MLKDTIKIQAIEDAEELADEIVGIKDLTKLTKTQAKSLKQKANNWAECYEDMSTYDDLVAKYIGAFNE